MRTISILVKFSIRAYVHYTKLVFSRSHFSRTTVLVVFFQMIKVDVLIRHYVLPIGYWFVEKSAVKSNNRLSEGNLPAKVISENDFLERDENHVCTYLFVLDHLFSFYTPCNLRNIFPTSYQFRVFLSYQYQDDESTRN